MFDNISHFSPIFGLFWSPGGPKLGSTDISPTLGPPKRKRSVYSEFCGRISIKVLLLYKYSFFVHLRLFSSHPGVPKICQIFSILRVAYLVTHRNGTDSFWFSGIIRDISRRHTSKIDLIFIFRSFMRRQRCIKNA